LIFVGVLIFLFVIPVAAKDLGLGGNEPNFPTGIKGIQAVITKMQQRSRQTFALVGTIAAIDPVLMTLTI